VFRIYKHLYPFEKLLSLGLFLKEEMALKWEFRRSGAVGTTLSQNTLCLSSDIV